MSNPLGYTANAVARQGVRPSVESVDGRLALELSTPESLGGTGGDGTNPEELLATGYAACLLSAIRLAALQDGAPIDGAEVRCELTVASDDAGAFRADVRLQARLPSLPQERARSILRAATEAWPYGGHRRPELHVDLADDAADESGAARVLEARRDAADEGGYS